MLCVLFFHVISLPPAARRDSGHIMLDMMMKLSNRRISNHWCNTLFTLFLRSLLETTKYNTKYLLKCIPLIWIISWWLQCNISYFLLLFCQCKWLNDPMWSGSAKIHEKNSESGPVNQFFNFFWSGPVCKIPIRSVPNLVHEALIQWQNYS